MDGVDAMELRSRIIIMVFIIRTRVGIRNRSGPCSRTRVLIRHRTTACIAILRSSIDCIRVRDRMVHINVCDPLV